MDEKNANLVQYSLTAEAIRNFLGRPLPTDEEERLAYWEEFTDTFGPMLLPFLVRPDAVRHVPFAALNLHRLEPGDFKPHAGEMWVLFRFMQDAQIHDDSTSPLRTDGFVLVLEWREGKGDSALLSEPVRALAEAVRSRLGVSGWGLWPSGERYGDKVSFADASVFADSDNAERVASAWGALAAGLLCATSNRHPPFWPFPTLQWDEKGGRIAGVEGLKEKFSVAADCGARVVTVAQEQKRDACELLEKMRLGPDGARFKRLSVYAVKSQSDPRRLAERIAFGASDRRRLIRRIVVLGVTLPLAALLLLGGAFAYDSLTPVERYYRDYVVRYGVPQGLFEVSKSDLTGSHAYRFTYRGYESFNLWRRKRVLRELARVNGYGCVINEEQVSPLHAKTARQRLEYDEEGNLARIWHLTVTGRVEEVHHYMDEGGVVKVAITRISPNTGETHVDGFVASTNASVRADDKSDETVHALKVVRDSQGFVRSILYLNNAENEIPISKNPAKVEFDHDNLGRTTMIRHLSWDGRLVEDDKGVAKVRMLQGDYGVDVMVSERSDSSIVSQVEADYDAKGNMTGVRRFGEGGVRLLTDEWAIGRVGGYDSGGEFGFMRYYDANSNAFDSAESQIIQKAKYDNGRLVELDKTFSGKNGAAPPEESYFSRITLRYDKDMNLVERCNYGADGALFKSSTVPAVCRFVYDGSGRIAERSFLSATGALMKGPAGWARMSDTVNGLVRWVRYFGEDGKPTFPLNDESPAIKMTYEKGTFADGDHLVRTEVFGLDGTEKTNGASGWHRAEYEYNRFGRIQSCSFYDTDGSRVLGMGTVLGYDFRFWKVESKCNPAGNNISEAFYGIDGKLMNTEKGYAMAIAEYDDKRRKTSIALYGKDKGLVIPAGETFCRFENRENGLQPPFKGTTRAYRLDGTGEERHFNDLGQLVRITSLGVDGRPCIDSNGIVSTVFDCDSHGRPLRQEFRGLNDEKIQNDDGIAVVERKYDELGNRVETRFLGLDGKLKGQRGGGVAFERYEFKGRNCVSRDCYNVTSNRTYCTDGFAGERHKYNDRGDLIETYAIDTNGDPMEVSGFVVFRKDYDESHHVITQRYFNVRHEPMCTEKFGHGQYMEYDSAGNQTKLVYFDLDRKPMRVDDGCFGYAMKYDNRGRVVEYRPIDKNGNHAETKEYTHMGLRFSLLKRTFEYQDDGSTVERLFAAKNGSMGGADAMATTSDVHGNVICVEMQNTFGKLVDSEVDGWARNTMKYNEYRECVEQAYFHANGDPAISRHYGTHKTVVNFRRNQDGLVQETVFQNTNGFPVCNREFGFAREVKTFDYRGFVVNVENFDDKQIRTGLCVFKWNEENGLVEQLYREGLVNRQRMVEKTEFVYSSEEQGSVVCRVEQNGQMMPERRVPVSEVRQMSLNLNRRQPCKY